MSIKLKDVVFSDNPWLDRCFSENEMEAYHRVRQSLRKHEYEIDIHDLGLSECQFSRVWEFIPGPLDYYINGYEQSMDKNSDSIFSIRICVIEDYNEAWRRSIDKQIEDKVNDLYDDLHICGCSDLEIEKKIHDWIIENTTWNYRTDDSRTPELHYHTVIGILLNGRGVCSSISLAASLLLNCFGVPAVTINGYPLNDKPPVTDDSYDRAAHQWLLVMVKGSWYHLDIAWDFGTDYSYFNLDNSECSIDHLWCSLDHSWMPLCICSDMCCNYHKIMGMYAQNRQELYYILSRVGRQDEPTIRVWTDDDNEIRLVFEKLKPGVIGDRVVSRISPHVISLQSPSASR